MLVERSVITVVIVKVVLASGHLTDGPGRTAPRFPESSVVRIRAEIRRQLEDWGLGAGDLLICGGGRGGDLLAAEQALELKASVRLCLALPREQFVARSVALPGTDWLARFDKVASASDVRVQEPPAAPDRVFEAANDWMVSDAREAGASEVYALVVWDGQGSRRPGGAADFAHRAAMAGITLYGIDPTPRLSATRQWAEGPKKVLSLDGGGIRGALSLGILASIEAQLRAWAGQPDLVLADYYDYIAGTSTGAIIAAGLSLGKPVSEVLDRYLSLGRKVFRFNWLSFWVARHPTGPLLAELNALLGAERRLGDPELRTLLAVVLHNADTDSPWLVSNCPSARYNRPERRLSIHPERGGAHVPDRNLDLSLCELIRGSTAAPTYFAPQDLRVGSRVVRFQDGGVTPYNNPALLAYAMATQREYQVRWRAGADDLLVVSVGTGSAAARSPRGWPGRLAQLPAVFSNGASIGQDYLSRVAGKTVFGFPIDAEAGQVLHGHRLFTYARYSVDLGDLRELRAAVLGVGVEEAEVRALDAIALVGGRTLAKLNATGHVEDLHRLGALAGRLVDVEAHFRGFEPA